MYVRTTIAVPGPGKSQEVEALAREATTAAQAAGAVAGLSQRVLSGTSAFVARTIVPDMAGVTALRAQAAAPEGQALVARIDPLLREPLVVQLHEVLLPAPAGSLVGATYALFARVYPAIGQAGAVLALSTDEGKAEQEQGIPVTFSRLVVAPEGGVFTAAYPLADLLALEQLTQQLAATPRWQTYIAQVAPLLRLPIQQALEAVLIPFPS